MTTYDVNISIDNDSLDTMLSANEHVTIVKANEGASLQVVWLAIDPEQNIDVSWQIQYEIYQSRTILRPDATIITSAQTKSASPGKIYKYLTAGHFDPGTADPDNPNAYGAYNDDNRHKNAQMTFGLVQAALVGGGGQTGPINAQLVPYAQTARFTPVERVLLYVSGITNNGVVISEVSSQALEIDLTEKPSQKAVWSPDEGKFILA